MGRRGLDKLRTESECFVFHFIFFGTRFQFLHFVLFVCSLPVCALQHPIFPWVVADWTSADLNLNDPATFRDLRWPMGAQSDGQV